METKQTDCNKLKAPIRCIVKLGGAAITCKNDFEKINEDNLVTVSSQLREAMMMSGSSTSAPVLDMDWSKRPGSKVVDADPKEQQQAVDYNNFIVIHGAGSFGHFQASKSGVHKGGLTKPLVKAGFVATRISVTSLNLEIVRALAREGIPSVAMSPFSCGWSTRDRNIASADVSTVVQALDSGFVPVLHGDVVLDESLVTNRFYNRWVHYIKWRCNNKSSGSTSEASICCFPYVFGVYDRPPSEPNAVLLREIAVREDGSWSVVNPTFQGTDKQVEISVASHDTTGGMVTKISEAAMIAKLGIDVYIVKAATEHSQTALSGKLIDKIPEDWLGTVIRYVS
ncbi:isopentenyl phosphate kinase isoform X1 [Rutidosis leptorrhynchoides]|uniref:isopentenyl phosphate kinase isoform X1 n=1 Tax=Rutidosis leptorrhynchoides TaxID=125765 RepID=UPI003A98F6D1